MEISPASLVIFLNRLHERVHPEGSLQRWLDNHGLEIVPPNPYWLSSAAAGVVNQHLTQSRLAQVLGAQTKLAEANASVVEEFTECVLATPFDGLPPSLGTIVVVYVPIPIQPHWDVRYPNGVPGLELMLAGAQFQKAAQVLESKSESAVFANAAARLFEEGLFRLAAKSE